MKGPGAPAPPPASGDGRALAPRGGGDPPAGALATPDASEGVGAPAAPGWSSRGYLPHQDYAHVLQNITFRLADALPRQVVERLQEGCTDDTGLHRRRIEAYLDAGHGSCLLAQRACAQIVEDCLLHRDAVDYRLLAWVVMPNHVHVLIEPLRDLAGIVQAWKSVSAHRLKETLGERAPRVLWQREYWDRWIRDEGHRQQAQGYIHANPVAAGLVERGEDWRWGSAWRR